MAMKQEQEEASPEVREVAPGVLRMQLPIQMPGLGHVNMYGLLDDRGVALVDPGLPGEESWAALLSRLDTAGLRLRDVHTVVVTHSHPDHFGGAGRLHSETGCRVIAHHAFQAFGQGPFELCTPEPSVDDLEDALAHRRPREVLQSDDTAQLPGEPWERPRTPWGGQPPTPSPEQRKRWEQMRASASSLLPRITHVVEHGSAIRLARRDWFVWFTPGHTSDHICLHDPDEGVFVAGDHVLPSITPHISGLTDKQDPLQMFYDSLDEVAAIEGVQRCLPAHGHPFEDLQARAHAIRRHHDERLTRIREISRRLGPADVESISHELFHERNWGSMAESETFAHLEHLRLRDLAESHRDDDGMLIYVTG